MPDSLMGEFNGDCTAADGCREQPLLAVILQEGNGLALRRGPVLAVACKPLLCFFFRWLPPWATFCRRYAACLRSLLFPLACVDQPTRTRGFETESRGLQDRLVLR
jgi:hypothetical protein